MASTSDTRCIYCKEARPSSNEHILQRALGGNLTTNSLKGQPFVVCEQCNHGFSKIDQSLAERSAVAISRVKRTDAKMAVQLGGDALHRLEEADIWAEVVATNKMSRRLMPQLHFRDDGATGSIHGECKPEIDEFVALLAKRIGDGTIAKAAVKVGPEDKCSTVRIAQPRRKKSDLFVRAPTREAAAKFLTHLSSSWPKIEAACRSGVFDARHDGGAMVMGMQICFDDNYRAVAKTAFNVMAAKFGGSFALRSEFDDIREYIRGNSLVHESFADGRVELMDGRFVLAAGAMLQTSNHMVILTCDGSRIRAHVTLYGSHFFLVELGRFKMVGLSSPVREFAIAHEFAIDRSWNREVEIAELDARVSENGG